MAQHYESVLTKVKIKQQSTNIWPMIWHKFEGKFFMQQKKEENYFLKGLQIHFWNKLIQF